ncbi:hypothetical protein [Helicobacter cetorum]|uniref:hypothetical protein n=1 Tax=Helicobacter cetorum TaxID=138563 RepID=UPI000CF012C3|nr:hypothetical protein [Helicobacter cetorum]
MQISHSNVLEVLEQEVIKALSTSFGLDFLLFKDKKGGDVNTIHNVRQGVYASDIEKQRYENRGEYNSHDYHSHQNYINKGRGAKEQFLQGNLNDVYRDKNFKSNEQRNLDHIISAKEVHDDPARVLAELEGADLANVESNFAFTHESINKSKKAMTTQDFIEKLPSMIENKENNIKKFETKLQNTTSDIERQKLQDSIRKKKENVKALKSVDKEKMLEADKKAREIMNAEINWEYYTSSKFFKNTAFSVGKSGLAMGARQALGLVLAEIYFEIKTQIPIIYHSVKENFKLGVFLEKMTETLKGIFERVKERFKEIWTSFKGGVVAGIFSSLSTTLINIFTTTAKKAIKGIREIFNTLVQVVKALFKGASFKEIIKLILACGATLIGTIIYSACVNLFTFPFGTECAAFLSALATGLISVGLCYLVDNWGSLLKNKFDLALEHMQEMNAELDRYLLELARIEFNINPSEVQMLASSLNLANSEEERGIILDNEVQKRGIKLPYESGNTESIKSFLSNLYQK